MEAADAAPVQGESFGGIQAESRSGGSHGSDTTDGARKCNAPDRPLAGFKEFCAWAMRQRKAGESVSGR